MDFELGDERRMIADSLGRLLAGYGEAASGSPELWTELVDLGMLGLTLSEDAGGLGISGPEILTVSREMGRHQCTAPWLTAGCLGGALVSLLAANDRVQGLAPGIAAGETRLAVAFNDSGRGYDLGFAARAETTADGYRISGEKAVVIGADSASHILVPARIGEEAALFLVAGDDATLRRRDYRLVDGRGAADLVLDGTAAAAPVARGAEAETVLAHLWDIGAIAVLAEADGALDAIMALTVSYLNEREQFGKAIGTFQALQHMLAECQIDREHLKSLILDAAANAGAAPEQRAIAISAAKVYLTERGRRICERAIQMHGGIGMTDEYRLGGLVKRVTAAEFLFGDHDLHLARYAAGVTGDAA